MLSEVICPELKKHLSDQKRGGGGGCRVRQITVSPICEMSPLMLKNG